MNLILLAITIFLAGSLFILVMLYLIFSPSKDRALKQRLQTIKNQYAVDFPGDGTENQDILSQLPPVDRFLFRIPAVFKLSFFIQQAGMEIAVGRLLAIIILIFTITCITGLLLGSNIIFVSLIALILAAIPFLVVAVKRYKRFSNFEEQFPEAIDLLARAVRAGHAFTTGFELIGNEMPEPVAGEFRQTYEQQNLGLPIKEAFQNLLQRVPLPDVHVFVTALNIQRESGGNLAEILDNLSRIIRERFKLKKQVRVYTAQGRITLYILTALPPALTLFFYASKPDYISLLFTTSTGIKMIAVAIFLQLLGFFTISRIVRPKI